jgi:hypothetical protein
MFTYRSLPILPGVGELIAELNRMKPGLIYGHFTWLHPLSVSGARWFHRHWLFLSVNLLVFWFADLFSLRIPGKEALDGRNREWRTRLDDGLVDEAFHAAASTDAIDAPLICEAGGHYPTYRLYDIDYLVMTVDDWHSSPPEWSSHSDLWEQPSCFEPSTYLSNIHSCSGCDSVLGMVPFLAFLTVGIVILVLHAPEKSASVPLRKVIGFPFLFAFGISLVEFLCLIVSPFVFMRFGMWIFAVLACGFAVGAVIMDRSAARIVLAVLIVIFSFFYYKWMQPGIEFSVALLKFFRSVLGSAPVLLTFLFFAGLTASFEALMAYVAYWGTLQKVYVLVVVAVVGVWHLILVSGELVHQFMAQTMAAVYFVGPRAGEPREYSFLRMFGRLFCGTFGVACFNATVLPFVHLFYAVGRVHPIEVRERLLFMWRVGPAKFTRRCISAACPSAGGWTAT